MEYEENNVILERVIYERLVNGSIVEDPYFQIEHSNATTTTTTTTGQHDDPTLIPILSWVARALGSQNSQLHIVIDWELYSINQTLTNDPLTPDPLNALFKTRQAALLGPLARDFYHLNSISSSSASPPSLVTRTSLQQSEQLLSVQCNSAIQHWDQTHGQCIRNEWHLPVAHEQALISWWLLIAIIIIVILVLCCLCYGSACFGRKPITRAAFKTTNACGPSHQTYYSPHGALVHHHAHHHSAPISNTSTTTTLAFTTRHNHAPTCPVYLRRGPSPHTCNCRMSGHY